ncbi:hypothetical protein K439DRAFT_1654493 [Ramaria rubella]|nr:hypothetical protein K439DRAFT_1654493 [Ramaria rubella]
MEIPRVNYTLHTRARHRAIALFACLLLAEAGVLPLILYFSLKWGAHLSITKNLAIITSVVGTFSGYKFAKRMWHLWFAKDSHERRPIGAGRWGVDASQVLISIALFGFFVPLVIGSSLTPASVPIVSMAIPLFMITICLPLLITGLFAHHIRFPLRVSSLPAYEPLPPGTFTLVEDIVAVDGGGRLPFREAWRARYEASAVMRKLLRDLAIFWGLSGSFAAGGFIAISWTSSDDIGYGIAYGVPWLWAITCAGATALRTRRELDREEREWGGDTGHVEKSLHIRRSPPPAQAGETEPKV